jgi:Rrf2 family nitric oxide-sensitive transcriptional repressor
MRLTTFSDYALLTLMYLAVHPNRFVTIGEIAAAYGISANHLMKVTQDLSANGTVITLRGQRGGLRLAQAAADVRVGDIIRRTERDLDLTRGIMRATSRGEVARPVDAGSVLPMILDQALAAFMAVLDRYSVADLVADRGTVPS